MALSPKIKHLVIDIDFGSSRTELPELLNYEQVTYLRCIGQSLTSLELNRVICWPGSKRGREYGAVSMHNLLAHLPVLQHLSIKSVVAVRESRTGHLFTNYRWPELASLQLTDGPCFESPSILVSWLKKKEFLRKVELRGYVFQRNEQIAPWKLLDMMREHKVEWPILRIAQYSDESLDDEWWAQLQPSRDYLEKGEENPLKKAGKDGQGDTANSDLNTRLCIRDKNDVQVKSEKDYGYRWDSAPAMPTGHDEDFEFSDTSDKEDDDG